MMNDIAHRLKIKSIAEFGDNRPKLFRKTNISNDVVAALHPIVGRSSPDTVGALPNDLPNGSCSPANEAEVRRLSHANAGSDLVPQFVTSRDVLLEFKGFVTLTAW